MNSSGKPGHFLRRLAAQREYGVLALLILTVAATALKNPAFLQPQNISDMLVKSVPALIVGCGLTLVIILGEIDISVGSLMGLSAAVLGLLTSRDHANWPVWMGILVTLLLGAGAGLINGLLITIGRVPSIIVTLGMLTAMRGLTDLLMGGDWIQGLPESLLNLGKGSIAGVPISVITATIVAVLFFVLALRTPFGRRVYAVGSNPKSAVLAGISETRIKIAAFVITGVLTALATIVSVTQLSVIQSGIGSGFELLVVTCVVVGGTSISGGRGTIAGTLLGVVLLNIIGTALIFLKLSENATYWEPAIQGAFILLAVLADHLAVPRGGAH